MSKVGIVMGSDSDLSIMKAAMETLEKFGIDYDVTVISAHRMPDIFFEYAKSAESKYDVLIAGAGGAAHLPGMALYSIVQMPAGIPVATVAINGAKNAAILAAKIISVREPGIRQKIKDFAEGLKDEVLAKKTKIEKAGYKTYLDEMN